MKTGITYSIKVLDENYSGLEFLKTEIFQARLLVKLLLDKDIEFQMKPDIEEIFQNG